MSIFIFLTVVQALIAAVLVGLILMQRSEGGGLGIGGSPSGFMSARGAADFLTRSTAILATLFVLLSIVLAALADVIREALDVTYATVRSRKGAEGIKVALELHAQVVDAVVAGDPNAASRAMTEHFRYWHDGET